jgi:hypothetical protein
MYVRKVHESLRHLITGGGSDHSVDSEPWVKPIPTRTNIEKPKSILRKTSTGSSDKKKELSFSSIAIREYPVLIGDNPSVGGGVPLTIGWNHEKELAYGLEDYENDHRSEPKSMADMKFSQEERAEIAKNLGYSESKIERIARKVKFSTLTRKKKVVKALHLDAIKENVNKGVTKLSDATKRLRGIEEEDEDDRDELAY